MITFISAFYILQSKFSKEKYDNWMYNLLSNIENFKLVLFTNKNSKFLLKKYEQNKNIKIVLLEIEEFYNYKYKNYWIDNHSKNTLLNCNNKVVNEMNCHKTSWKLNMLWNEKVSFVNKAYQEKYFDETEWYGWMDIGYFRGTCRGDISPNQIKMWPSNDKINNLDKEKVYYALVRKDKNYINKLIKIVNEKNDNGLPKNPIPETQWSIAGGFFVAHKKKLKWWFDMYDKKLNLYFNNNYLVKDDQIIIVDNIFSNLQKFKLVKESGNGDSWFVFQRYLL